MGKRKKIWKNDSQNSYKKPIMKFSEKDMDDEIDAFHKKNDVIPLVQEDDLMESDDDDELPVFNYKDIDGDEDDENSKSDDSENNIEDEEDMQNDHKLEKWEKVEKFMRAKVGGVEDEMDEEEEEDDDQKISSWGGKKYLHGADTVDFEIQSSDDEAAAMEEAEILRIQRERAKYLSMEDFGLNKEDQMKQEHKVEYSAVPDDEDDTEFINEAVRKDLGALSKEEQMDVVYSFAPELVVLLPSLNEILGKLETSINPLFNKIQGLEKKGKVSFVAVKKILYQVYCQTIVFYLLLKSEGIPVRNHPVIARLVELKDLLKRLHQVEKYLPPEIEALFHGELSVSDDMKGLLPLNLDHGDHRLGPFPSETQDYKPPENDAPEPLKTLQVFINQGKKSRREMDRVGAESKKMLQLRAAMEEKLKKDGVSTIAMKSRARENGTPFLSKKSETIDDFGDDVEGSKPKLARPTTLFELVTSKPKKPSRKRVVSGDADVAPREDIGERRRKYELRLLAKMSAMSQDGEIGEDDEPQGDFVKNKKDENINILSSDDLCPSSLPETLNVKHQMSRQKTEVSLDSDDESEGKIVKNKNNKTLLKDANISSRADLNPSPLESVEGKRHISQQMEKNRGLTRARKKADKNPRKKYRSKHDKAVMRRKGQVREIRKLKGSYGGEPTGINATISHSIRFKH